MKADRTESQRPVTPGEDGEVNINAFIAENSSTLDLAKQLKSIELEREKGMLSLMQKLLESDKKSDFPPRYMKVDAIDGICVILKIPHIEVNKGDVKNLPGTPYFASEVKYLLFSKKGFFSIVFNDYLSEEEIKNMQDSFNPERYRTRVDNSSYSFHLLLWKEEISELNRQHYDKFISHHDMSIDSTEAMSIFESVNRLINSQYQERISSNENEIFSINSFNSLIEGSSEKNKHLPNKRRWPWQR